MPTKSPRTIQHYSAHVSQVAVVDTYLQDLIVDQDRNQQITADVCAALARGRNCLVLTTWTAHLQALTAILRQMGAVPGRAAGGRLTAAGWPIRCRRYSYLHPWLADSVVEAAARGFGPWWTRNVRGMLRAVAPAAQRGCCGPEERPYADVPKSAYHGSRGPRLSQFQRGLS